MQVAIVNAFKRFPDYQFIMKFDGPVPEAKGAENLHITKWFPQRDLLGHPAVKAFVTHGGFNSILESTRSGVPLVVIPLLGDQLGNQKRVERHGVGIGLNKLELTEFKIFQALNEILRNSR